MKIKDIEFFPLRLEVGIPAPASLGTDAEPDKQRDLPPEVIAAQRYAPPEAVFVRIFTDDVYSGLGDGATLPHYFAHGVGSMQDWLARFRKVLIGCDPLNIAAIHRQMELVASIGVPGCRPAQAAIDMAIYDLAGKAHDCPVYELLGGAFRTEFGLQTQMHGHSVEQLLAVCRHYTTLGFQGLKLKIGGQIRRDGYTKATIDSEADKVAGVAAGLPHHIQVDVDANQTLGSPKIAIGMFERVLRTTFHPNLAIEQPLHHLDLAGHAFIRRALPLPVILDEAVTSPTAMLQIVRMQAADRIVLKPNRVGGLWPARKIVSLCEANGIGISLDTMPFTTLGDTMLCHLAATLRTPYPLDAEGHSFFVEDPFIGGVELEGGRARIPNGAGFGIEVDEDRLAKMAITA